jgi:hypothetical protein
MKFPKIVFWIAGALGLLPSVGLYFQCVAAADFASNAIPHGLLGVLFVIAYLRTPKREAGA